MVPHSKLSWKTPSFWTLLTISSILTRFLFQVMSCKSLWMMGWWNKRYTEIGQTRSPLISADNHQIFSWLLKKKSGINFLKINHMTSLEVLTIFFFGITMVVPEQISTMSKMLQKIMKNEPLRWLATLLFLWLALNAGSYKLVNI